MKNTIVKTSSIKEFKELLRMDDLSGDPWGTSVGAWFICASHLYEIGDCPAEWQYRPGSMGNHIDTDSAYYEMFSEMSAEQLEEIGQLLWRYSELLERHGRDY